RAGEPVELGDGQGVALADGGQSLVEAGPGAASAGEPLVKVDAFLRDPESGQGLALGGEVLGQGGAPGVADVRHPVASLSVYGAYPLQHSPYTLTETPRAAPAVTLG